MNKSLQELVNEINNQIKDSGAFDMSVKRALANFADAYKRTPDGDAAKVGEDNAAIEFLEAVFGKDNSIFKVYWDFYEAAKKGEAEIVHKTY